MMAFMMVKMLMGLPLQCFDDFSDPSPAGSQKCADQYDSPPLTKSARELQRAHGLYSQL